MSLGNLVGGQVQIILKHSLLRSIAHTRSRSQFSHTFSRISSDLLSGVFDELRRSNLATWNAPHL